MLTYATLCLTPKIFPALTGLTRDGVRSPRRRVRGGPRPPPGRLATHTKQGTPRQRPPAPGPRRPSTCRPGC